MFIRAFFEAGGCWIGGSWAIQGLTANAKAQHDFTCAGKRSLRSSSSFLPEPRRACKSFLGRHLGLWKVKAERRQPNLGLSIPFSDSTPNPSIEHRGDIREPAC